MFLCTSSGWVVQGSVGEVLTTSIEMSSFVCNSDLCVRVTTTFLLVTEASLCLFFIGPL